MKPDTERPGGAEASKARISLFSLEKQLLGELSPKQSAALGNEVRTNPELSAYIENLKRRESPLDWIRVQRRLDQRESLKESDSFLAVMARRLDALFPETDPSQTGLGRSTRLTLHIPRSGIAFPQAGSGIAQQRGRPSRNRLGSGRRENAPRRKWKRGIRRRHDIQLPEQ